MFANLANAGQDGVLQAGRGLMFLNTPGIGLFINEASGSMLVISASISSNVQVSTRE
jgi:hypothetical protein